MSTDDSTDDSGGGFLDDLSSLFTSPLTALQNLASSAEDSVLIALVVVAVVVVVLAVLIGYAPNVKHLTTFTV